MKQVEEPEVDITLYKRTMQENNMLRAKVAALSSEALILSAYRPTDLLENTEYSAIDFSFYHGYRPLVLRPMKDWVDIPLLFRDNHIGFVQGLVLAVSPDTVTILVYRSNCLPDYVGRQYMVSRKACARTSGSHSLLALRHFFLRVSRWWCKFSYTF